MSLKGMSVTLSPELITRESKEPSPSEVSDLSFICRTSAKASCLFVADVSLLSEVVSEQHSVFGEYPGPRPVLYRPRLPLHALTTKHESESTATESMEGAEAMPTTSSSSSSDGHAVGDGDGPVSLGEDSGAPSKPVSMFTILAEAEKKEAAAVAVAAQLKEEAVTVQGALNAAARCGADAVVVPMPLVPVFLSSSDSSAAGAAAAESGQWQLVLDSQAVAELSALAAHAATLKDDGAKKGNTGGVAVVPELRFDPETALNSILEHMNAGRVAAAAAASEEEDGVGAEEEEAKRAVEALSAAVQDESAVGQAASQAASASGGSTVLFDANFCNAFSPPMAPASPSSAPSSSSSSFPRKKAEAPPTSFVAPPAVRKSLSLVGVVEVPPGQNLLKSTVKSLSDKGFSGVMLGARCGPPDLGLVDSGRFWAAVLGMLRSKASETFQVRLQTFSKEANAPDAWSEYMQMSYDEGLRATDDIQDGDSSDVDASRGDHKGF